MKVVFYSVFFAFYFSPFVIAGSSNGPQNFEKITVLNNGNNHYFLLDKALTTNNNYFSASDLVAAPATIGEAISTVTGVSRSGQGGLLQSYNIRGFSRARIKTEVDGITIVSDRRAGNSLSFLPVHLVSNIGIKKGPQSALYGSDAIGGVVSLSTKSSNSLVGVTLQPQDDGIILFASGGNEIFDANIVSRKANQAQSSSSLNTSSSVPLNTGYEQLSGSASANFTFDNVDIYTSVIGSNGNDIGKSSITFPQSQITDYLKDDHLLAQVTLSQQGRWKLQVFTHDQAWNTQTKRLQNSEISRTNLVEYSSTTIGAIGLWRSDNTIVGVDWLARNNIDISESEFNQKNKFVWQNNSVSASQNTYSVYGLKHYNIADINLEVGARYDYLTVEQFNTKKYDEHVSFSLSGLYEFNSSTELSAEFANGFRFPTASELFFSGETPRGNTQGNSALKPETSIGFELGLVHRFNRAIFISFSAYLYNIDDYIERYTLDDVRYYQNDNLVKMRGTELSFNYEVSHSLSLKATLQKQWATDSNSQQIDDSVPSAIKLWARWQNNNWSVTNQVLYQFSRGHVGPSELEKSSELVIDSSLTYQVNKHLNIALAVNNITNNLYTASADEDAPYQSERTASLTAIWEF